jgi:hypothetical protein
MNDFSHFLKVYGIPSPGQPFYMCKIQLLHPSLPPRIEEEDIEPGMSVSVYAGEELPINIPYVPRILLRAMIS